METSLTTQKQNLPATQQAWGVETIEAQDTSKIFITLCQKQIPGTDTKPGDILRSDTKEVLGGEKSPVEVVFIKHYKEWVVTNRDGEVKNRTLYTEKTALLKEGPLAALIDDEECSRHLAHVFFALVVGKEHLGPVVISFMKSNKRVAEGLLSILISNARLGLSIAAQTFKISSMPVSYKKFNWYSYKIESGNKTTPELEESCRKMYMELKAAQERMEAMSTESEEAPF